MCKASAGIYGGAGGGREHALMLILVPRNKIHLFFYSLSFVRGFLLRRQRAPRMLARRFTHPLPRYSAFENAARGRHAADQILRSISKARQRDRRILVPRPPVFADFVFQHQVSRCQTDSRT